jgi:hypothetical protein
LVGEINESAKTNFLGRAAGLLFPIDWPEPFGLVMIEAMACGTPVLAFRGGSVPEIIEDGLPGTSSRKLRKLCKLFRTYWRSTGTLSGPASSTHGIRLREGTRSPEGTLPRKSSFRLSPVSGKAQVSRTTAKT